MGFTGVTYSLIPIGLSALISQGPVFLTSSNFSPAFLDHYLNANFAADDFTIKQILKRDLTPKDWWAEAQKGALISTERHVIQVAKTDYGISNGLSIPTLSTPQLIAGASVISDAATSCHFAMLINERSHILQTIIKLFHHRVCSDFEYRKFFYLPLLSKLTEREKRVLTHTVTGQAYKTIDGTDGISASSASNVRSVLFKQFGVKNASELAYLTGLHNLIEMI
jgi:DNA-binding CsgD family transcriptional regulator